MIEQHGPDAATLVIIHDGERDLGAFRSRVDVATNADDALILTIGLDSHKGDVLAEVDFGEVDDCLVAEFVHSGEEPKVDRSARQSMECVTQPSLIVWPDRSNMSGCAVK